MLHVLPPLLSLALFAPGVGQEPSLTRRVDALFAQFDRDDSPGCALGVVQDGRLVYSEGYGMANLELEVAITPRTAFYVGSTSKQFAAASTLLAARQGHFYLDDDISEYVPEIPGYGHTITIRNLVHHTSGIRDYLSLLDLGGRIAEIYSTDDVIGLMARQEALNFDPGEEYSYSNSGYVLQAEIIERATGQSLRDFSRENIFRPLGMHDTQFRDSRSQLIPNRATSYIPGDEGGYTVADLPNFEEVGDGGLYTTVEDLFLWDQNFYDATVGGEGYLEQLQTPGTLNSGESLEYAFGLFIHEYNGLPVVEHAGGFMGYRAQLVRFPEERFSVICLCNLGTANPVDLAYRVAGLYLSDRFAEVLQPFVGTYHSAELDTIYTVEVEDGHLQVQAGVGRTVALAPGDDRDVFQPAGSVEGSFSFSGATVHFTRDERGRVTGFNLNSGRAQNIRFTKH